MKKVVLRSIAVLMMLVLTLGIFMPTAKAEFSDLRPDHWCYNKIMDFEEMGYVSGYDDGEFKPDRTITRAEYVTIVNNFFGYEADTENTAEFLDVSENDWFEPYVSEAVKRGYISGYPDGTFKPYEPIRRQEATIILAKIIDIHDEEYDKDHEDGLAQYEDGEEVDDWAYKAVHSYSVYNFINGYEDNTIRLFRNVSRAETVQLLNTVEEKVIIDRENKTNEIKDKPSGGTKRVRTPIIEVIEENNENTWYSLVEAGEDGNVTVKVTTSTKNANITVKVNGEIITTNILEVETGSGVTFELPEGEYEITASAKKSGYKASQEATANVKIDIQKPVVSGKINEEAQTVSLYAKDNLSGISSEGIQYAWFVSDETGYIRVSNWENIEENIAFPTEPQNYYIGIKGADIAENKIDGGLIDSIADVYDEEGNPDGKVTDEVKDEPYDILKEIIINEKGHDKEEDLEGPEEPTTMKFITFHKNDGTEKTYKQNIELEGDTVLEKDIFFREEYTFVGWAETANGNKMYDDGATVNFTDSKELYAIWELNEPSEEPIIVEVKVTVVFDGNGGIGEMAPQIIKYGETAPLTVNTFTKVGYTFTGWSKSVDGEKVYDDAANYEALNNETLYAVWNINEYTLTFDTNGGNEIAPITQNYGTDITAPSNPEKEGYTFAGWDKEIPTTMPAKNMTITASWTKDSSKWYTVTFIAGDNGSFEGTPETNYKDILSGKTFAQAGIDIPTPIADDGYEFDEWTPSEPTSATVVNSNLIFTATFITAWEAPDIEIDSFESVNVTNNEGERAEPGTEIVYEVVITNHDTELAALIDIEPESGMTVVSPESYTNITLAPGESVSVIVKKTVPSDYEVAGNDFEARIDVVVKSDNSGSNKEVVKDYTSNKIEKTAMVKKGELVNKNIVMTIDFSGSMLYCCSHDRPDTSKNEIFSVIDDGKKYQLCSEKGGAIGDHRLRPNHYYRESSSSPVLYCSDLSRIRALQLGFDEFVDKLYSYYQTNNIDFNIEIVLFAEKASATCFKFNSETTNETIKEWFDAMINTLENKEESSYTGNRNYTKINLGIEKTKNVLQKYENVNEDTYSIYFGDGGLENNQYAAKEQDCNTIRDEYATSGSYVIGFGPFDYDLLKTDLATENKNPYVLHAWTKNDIVKALSAITDEIMFNEQSCDGIIQVEVDGKFYPIIATYDNDGVPTTLFTITKSSELAINDLSISNDEKTIIWELEGTKYSDFKGLSLKFGNELEYVTINYVASNGGVVSTTSENLAPESGVSSGSVATANDGYVFVNWTDSEGNEVSTAAEFIPEKVDGMNVPATYTANFAENIVRFSIPRRIVEEPVVEEPVVEEPVVEEPVVEEPVVEEPVVEEPVVEEPVVEEPVVEEPVVEEPVVEEPVVEEPVVEEPVVEEPVVEEPVVEEPVVEEPVVEEPVVEEPVVEEPVVEEPVVE